MTVEILRIKALLLAEADQGRPNYVVAAATGIHPAELSAYATGRKPISQKHLLTLADYFGTDPNEILGTYHVDVPV